MKGKSLLQFIVLLVVGYFVLIGLMAIFQNSLIFHPSSQMHATPDRTGIPWSDHYMEMEDGTKLHAWLFENEDADFTVILSHGNAGNISGRIDIAELLVDAGASVFMYDYRGFGNSEGSPSEKKVMSDAVEVAEYLSEQKGIGFDSMIFYGRSLGGPIAAYQAKSVGGVGLVLDSSFLNAKEVASDVYPFIPAMFIRADFPTDRFLREMDPIPVMIMHSPDDNIIRYRHGQELYEIAQEPKKFIELRGGHNDNFFRSTDIYETAWRDFIEQLADRGG